MATNSEKSGSFQLLGKPTSFSQVHFVCIPETYTAGADVQCSFVVTEDLDISSRDWVGLYKVGWRSSSDYFYYEWSPVPANYVRGKEVANRVPFPGSKLPKDDGEFYQFCYVAASGQVRGASPPFQFKHPMTDDLIEIEDENGELLVIRTKTAVLEDQLKKANENRAELKQKLCIMENERALLEYEKKDLEKKLADQKTDSELLRGQLRESMDRMADMQQETKDLQVCVRSLQEKMEVINQEKQTMEKRLDDSDVYIVSLQEKIKALVTEKETLLQAKKALEEDKEQYQNHIEAAEKSQQTIVNECFSLEQQLSASESSRVVLREQFEQLSQEVEGYHKTIQQHVSLAASAKENIGDLQENLRNVEDKLSAAETCKTMLNEEVLALRQAYDKLSSDLEKSKAETDMCRGQLAHLETKTAALDESKDYEMALVVKELMQKNEEIKLLSDEMAALRCQLEDSATHGNTDDDAMYHLQVAQATLNERYSKLQKKNAELQKRYDQMIVKLQLLEETDADQKQDITSLKERLMMGQDTYQEIFMEKQNLLSELNKLKKRRNDGTASDAAMKSASSHLVSAPIVDKALQTVEAEQPVTSLELTELQQQMEEIQCEMDKRTERVAKYKRLYSEEKKKCEEVTAQLQMLLQKPDDDVEQSSRECQSVVAGESENALHAESVDLEEIKKFDPLAVDESQRMLEPPLRPLPAPMQPEILPSAKMACVRASMASCPPSPQAVVVVKKPGGSETVYDISGDFETVSYVEDEKFVDALGEPQRPCSRCSEVFDSDSELAVHIATHDHEPDFICPVCQQKFTGEMCEPEFVAHVHSHFD